MSGGGIYTALSGAIAQSNALDVAAENVAHASTTGFRAERMRFEEVLHHSTHDTQVVATRGDRDPRQGPITTTGNPLDLALEGEGSLQVKDGHGIARDVRGGSFTRDADGVLVDLEGRHVMSEDGSDIVIPPDAQDIVIGEDGVVVADHEVVGKLLVNGNPRVMAGTLEGSNVNVVRSMVDLVKISRTYEALTRMIEGYKAIDERTARDIGPR